ncbi:MAG TPA: hypothetical protein PKW45_15905 [Bryobacteraceae bacterium]|jgi:hypothetical protein|nr:hypothetical protein [Bryobacteraceae bacterium]
MNQSQAQRDEEKVIFAAFYALQPDFAGVPIKEWRIAESDPPDIICITDSGRTIGVELAEWLHQREMSAGKLRERIEQQLLEAIGEPQPVNTSRHFDMVILHPRERVQIKAGPDQMAFRLALFELIADVDRRWPQEPFWHSPQGCHLRDLTGWPPLGVYLKEVHFHPGQSRWPEGINWILPPAHWDTFDDRTMRDPLLNVISAKITKYQTRRPMATPCDDLVLVAFFNLGVAYNSPIETPRRTLEGLVMELRAALPQHRGPVSRGYLFVAPTPGARVFRLW